jgi:predicted  nucleic acid-binding Zn-ribbon protein
MNKWYLVCVSLVAAIMIESAYLFNLNSMYVSLSSDYDLVKQNHQVLSSIHDNLSMNYSSLETNYTNLKSQYDLLKIDMATLESDYSALKADYSSASVENNELRTQYSTLSAQFNDLLKNLTDLKEQYAQLSQDYAILENDYYDLSTNYSSLRAMYQSLQTDYQNLQVQYTSLQSNYSTLQADYRTLLTQYNSLQTAYNNLVAEYNRYVAAYQKLRGTLNQRWDQENVKPFITPRDPAVTSIVYSITGGWSNPSDWNEYWSDVKAMYIWITNNIEYRYDGLSPMLPYDPSGDIEYLSEMWQFPNETLSLRKGDCEDQAILLCSMIRCYNDERYLVECIVIYSATSGHVAVQLPCTGDTLVILDPAGKYYSHDIWGNLAFRDVTTEINNWLDYWKPIMGNDVYVHRVFSDYIDKAFASTSDYITWMYNR